MNIKLGLTDFVSTAIDKTPEYDRSAIERVVPFGVSFLDRMLMGIKSDDLVLIGAPPGVGKTELAASIAINAAYNRYRVVCFALEATPGEWEQRTKYKLYMGCMIHKYGPESIQTMDFDEFDSGLYADKLAPFREVVEAQLKEIPSMQMYYRERDFGIAEFQRVFNAINDKADLVVIDHLHYFDTTDENENRAIAEIMKKIRDMNQLTGIPVVMVAHLRKRDKKNDALVADLPDLHGTSEIGKISTKIITLAPGEPVPGSDTRFYTYFRIPKARKSGRVTRYAGRGVFNVTMNEYEKEFALGRLSPDERKFIPFTEHKDIPAWYRERAKREARG